MARAKKSAASGTIAAATAAFQSVAAGVKVPGHVRLRDCDRPFWDSIVRARIPSDWAESDLAHVANLARCMADIERSQALLEQEGDTLANSRGTIVINPRHALLETLSRRAMALTRILQLHAVAKTGLRAHEIGHKKAEALEANRALAAASMEDDGLLATPMQ